MKPILATLFILFFSIQLSATEKKDTIRVLFIGNSYIYYNNLAQMISLISDSLDTKLICTKSTIGSATLGEHWNGLRGLKSKELITKNKYQVVVIQDNSMYPIEHRDSVLYYGAKFCSFIKSTGAKPFLYNTWARKKTPETQAQINEVYKTLSTEQDATRVLVGDSWTIAMQLKPEIELFHFDGSHPSYLGTFLIALNFIKKLTGTIPKKYATVYNYIDKDGETFRIMQLTDAEIQFCTKVVNSMH